MHPFEGESPKPVEKDRIEDTQKAADEGEEMYEREERGDAEDT